MARLIDADEVYKVLTDYYNHRTEIQHKALKEAIGRVPSVDAEPVKQGQWIVEGSRHFLDTRLGIGKKMKESLGRGYHTYQNRQCSVCRKISIVDASIMYEYCPHCGARMDEVEDGLERK